MFTDGPFHFSVLTLNFIDSSVNEYDNLERYISGTEEYMVILSVLYFSKVNITDWYYLIEIILAV